MKILFLIGLGVLLTTQPARCQRFTSATKPSEIRRLDGSKITFADAEALARRNLAENHVTGAQIAVLNHGHLVWNHSFGLRARDPDLPMQDTTVTWAAGITESIFATYCVQLAQAGQLPFEASIRSLLPRPLDSYSLYHDAVTDLVQDPLYSLLTPRNLLSETSGFADYSVEERDRRLHIHFIPGTRFAYSDDGINLLQFVIERRADKPLDELMQQSLFTPFHMDRSSLIYKDSFASDIADRFDANEKFIGRTQRTRARAAVSMTTTATDLATFLTALLSPDKKAPHILDAKALRAMLTPVVAITTAHEFPTMDQQEGTEAQAVGLGYALGWGVLGQTRFGSAIFKEGHGEGAQNYLICFVKDRDCMIILTNSDNGERAFRPLLEGILGDTVTPWAWEGYAAPKPAATSSQ